MASDPGDPRIGDVSEGTVLRAILARTGTARQALLGPGDDAAIIAAPSGSVVATTDTLVDGPDFRSAWSSGHDLGWKAAAVNLADVAAMGAVPTALLVALAVPRDVRVSVVADMADGFRDACDALAPGCAVVGGDLTVSDLLTIAVTALGDLHGRPPVTRAGARPGDAVVVAGQLGFAAAGLALLRAGLRQPASVVEAHQHPQVPYDAGLLMAAAGATAMIDVSDGLVADIGHVAEASAVRIELATAELPVADVLVQIGARVRADPLSWVAAGGEDHAFAAAVPADAVEEIAARLAALPEPVPFARIGDVVAGDTGVVFTDAPPPRISGHDHFA
jgi:thiamine-monophosphate kinase